LADTPGKRPAKCIIDNDSSYSDCGVKFHYGLNIMSDWPTRSNAV
jgi:hypothetical protein